MELPKTGKTFAYVNTEKSFFKKTFWNMDKEYEQMCYALNVSKELDPTDFSMRVLKRLGRFLKWCDVINSNSWFLAILKGFSEGLPLQYNVFIFFS